MAPRIQAFLLAVLSVFLMAPLAASAGDFAFEQVIGFSKDGRYFGFEEYGIQDGSGFPYSNIYVIDLETDVFAPQTPVRVRLDDEKASLQNARGKAAKEARAVLGLYNLSVPAVVAYARGLGDFADFDGGLSAPVESTIMLPDPANPTGPASERFQLVLSHVPARSVAKCPLDTLGFVLEKIDQNGKRRFVHRDEKILLSRGCPLQYRLSRVYVPHNQAGDYAAILMSVFQTGFEGPDRRFVVFPVRLH